MYAGSRIRRGLVLALAAGVPLVMLSLPGTTYAAADDAPLPNDPRLVTGEMANGMKYVIRKHGNPAGRASVWIHVSSGSLNETDKQRGIAHFLEHMAFNGSENFPPGSVVSFFESLGLTFGQHQNAFTSFDQTVYQLSLPNNKPESIDQALTFMSDVASRLTLPPAEIEKERQIILEEKRSRLGARQRIQDIVFKRIAPGSTFGERLPIGVEETILGVQPADFQDYYGKWYVPSNMTVLIVGDVDEKAVEAQIQAKMGGGERLAAPRDNPVGVKAATEPSAVVVQDKELTRAGVSMMRVTPARPASVTKADVRRDMVELLSAFAFNRRVEAKVNEGKASYQSGGGGVSSLFQSMVLAQAQAGGEPEKWEAILKDLAAEVQRARKFGFSESELEDVKKEVLSSAEQRAKQEDTYDARAILGRINNSIAEGEPIRSATQDLELVRELLPTIRASELGETFSRWFEPSGFVYVLELPESVKAPSEAEFLKIATAAMSAEVAAEAQAAKADKLLDSIPAAGTVSEQTEHAASAVGSAWLSNGVRVHHRFMDVEKNRVNVTIALLGGSMLETAENRGVTSAAINAWQRAATAKLSSTNIRDLMLGKKIEVGGLGGQESIRLAVTGDPADLETGLQLAYLLLTEPRIEDAAFSQWKTNQLQQIEASDKQPQQFFRKLVARTIYPAEAARTQPLTKENIEAITLTQAQAWLDRLIAQSPIEVAIVGDISRESAMTLAAQYLGALGKRDRIAPDSFNALREIKRPKGPLAAEKDLETQTPVAIALGGFFGPDSDNTADVRRMVIAERVLSVRMNKVIREEEQLVYSIGANLQPGGAYRGFGVFLAAAPTEPGKVPALVARVNQMFGEFAEKGMTSEELEVAKKQIRNATDEQMKQPGYWTGVLDLMTFEHTRLDDVIGETTAYDTITADEVTATFRSYYKPENTMSIVVKPTGPRPALPAPAIPGPASPAPAPTPDKK